MVDVEFIIDANEDTMAAAKAARISPLSPAGIKFLISQGAALSFVTFPTLPINPSEANNSLLSSPDGSKFITYAIIPGTTTITGINNFKNAANTIPF